MEVGESDSPVKNERGNYKEAQSLYRPLKHYLLNIPVKPYSTSRYTLLEFIPVTGRTHQLRIHANKLSHPIIAITIVSINNQYFILYIFQCSLSYNNLIHNRIMLQTL